jgi:hypothetical protein
MKFEYPFQFQCNNYMFRLCTLRPPSIDACKIRHNSHLAPYIECLTFLMIPSHMSLPFFWIPGTLTTLCYSRFSLSVRSHFQECIVARYLLFHGSTTAPEGETETKGLLWDSIGTHLGLLIFRDSFPPKYFGLLRAHNLIT